MYNENQRLKEELAKANAEVQRMKMVAKSTITYIDGWKNVGAPDIQVKSRLLEVLDPMYVAWNEAEMRSEWDAVPRTP